MDMADARWRTATRSSNNGGDCVEVADNLPGRVLVRDSKDRDGAALTFAPTAWASFIGAVSAASGGQRQAVPQV
ncbi:DUF397 domain-containing protein [Micromonospora sp. NPDC048842]|uniref:DUF397 domain-containing protein n=1 Tax=Micromonospora sp. NPDC048842 TaxID=3154346 RepID=UPI00340A4F1F